MIGHLKSNIKKFLLSQQIWLSKTTDKKQLLEFLDSVKPVRTNHDLIRIGGETDGGYLIPNDIEDINTCFSPGVSEIADFENDLTKRGIKCFLADYSVDAPPIENALFDFEKKYLGSKNNEIFITLESWIESKAPTKCDLILQMDIEGFEYPVIFDTSSEILNRFRILVIEFHNLDRLFNPIGFEFINLTFAKILKTPFKSSVDDLAAIESHVIAPQLTAPNPAAKLPEERFPTVVILVLPAQFITSIFCTFCKDKIVFACVADNT